MKKLVFIALSLISISTFAQRKSKGDSTIVEVPKASQDEITAIQSQVKKLNDAEWVKEQSNTLIGQINLIYKTLLVAKGVDVNKIDWQKTVIAPQGIIVRYLQVEEEKKK